MLLGGEKRKMSFPETVGQVTGTRLQRAQGYTEANSDFFEAGETFQGLVACPGKAPSPLLLPLVL